MSRYLTLINLTDKGAREVRESVRRANDFRATAEAAGGKVLQIYWAVGNRDGAVIFEAPDEHTGAALLLKLSAEGFVRTQTLRVYDADEFQQVLEKM
jgi:uncharacterized protein with GYD domain